MTEEKGLQAAAIIEGLMQRLDERKAIDDVTHAAHHVYVAMRMKERQLCFERREKIIQTVGGWAVIIGITAIGTTIWMFIKDHIVTR